MHLILCILLYLHLITGHTTYTTTQINNLETVNEILISPIEHNSLLLNLIELNYGHEADQIVIIDTAEE